MDFSSLVEKAAMSSELSGDRKLQALLRHLASLSHPHNKWDRRKASTVAQALNSTEDAVGRNVRRLQEKLQEFATGEGKELPYQLTVHIGGKPALSHHDNFLVKMHPVPSRPTALLWRPHVSSKGPVELVTNAPLFYRHSSGSYRVRVMGVNDKASRNKHGETGEAPDLSDFEECFHYVSVGDFRMCIALLTTLLKEGADVQVKVIVSAHSMDDALNPGDDLKLNVSTNLIVLGNSRVSWATKWLQEERSPNFYTSEEHHLKMRNREPKKGELREYEDKVGPKGTFHAAVIRHEEAGRVETWILVQNGPALEALASLLTDDEGVRSVLEAAGWTQFPKCFELLFSIPVRRKEAVDRSKVPTLLAWR